MIERQFSGRLHFFKQADLVAQLQEVIEKYSLKPEKEKLFGICLRCNKTLVPIDAEKVRDLVPPYVYQHCKSFNQCPVCLNIYWEGNTSAQFFAISGKKQNQDKLKLEIS